MSHQGFLPFLLQDFITNFGQTWFGGCNSRIFFLIIPFLFIDKNRGKLNNDIEPLMSISPTGPTEQTPKPEYLIALATYLGGPLVKVPFNFDGLWWVDDSCVPGGCYKVQDQTPIWSNWIWRELMPLMFPFFSNKIIFPFASPGVQKKRSLVDVGWWINLKESLWNKLHGLNAKWRRFWRSIPSDGL